MRRNLKKTDKLFIRFFLVECQKTEKMIQIKRTDSQDKEFINLVKQLDAYLKITDGDEHSFYNQFNNIDVLKHVIIIYKDNIGAGCGAIKKFNENTVEVKRMFVLPEFRGKQIAQKIVLELEILAKENGYKKSCFRNRKNTSGSGKILQKV